MFKNLGNSSTMSKVAKSFDILATSLSPIIILTVQ